MKNVFLNGKKWFSGSGPRRAADCLWSLLLTVALLFGSFPAEALVQGAPLICGRVEHQHTEGCYETLTKRVLSCPYENSRVVVIHHHEENCYEEGRLVCPLTSCQEVAVPQGDWDSFGSVGYIFGAHATTFGNAVDFPVRQGAELVSEEGAYRTYRDPGVDGLLVYENGLLLPHTHGTGCFDENGNLICDKAEAVSHQHGPECFREEAGERILICGLEEHVHGAACYAPEQVEPQEIVTEPQAAVHVQEDHSSWSDGSFFSGNGEVILPREDSHVEVVHPSPEQMEIGEIQQPEERPGQDSLVQSEGIEKKEDVEKKDKEKKEEKEVEEKKEEKEKTEKEKTEKEKTEKEETKTKEKTKKEKNKDKSKETSTKEKKNKKEKTEDKTEKEETKEKEDKETKESEETKEKKDEKDPILVEDALAEAAEEDIDLKVEAAEEEVDVESKDALEETDLEVEAAEEEIDIEVEAAEEETVAGNKKEDLEENEKEEEQEDEKEENGKKKEEEDGSEGTEEDLDLSFGDGFVAWDEVVSAPDASASSTLEYQGNGYSVRLHYAEDAQIPEGAYLVVEEILPTQDELYASYVAQARSALGMDERVELPEDYARFFDIQIYRTTKKGNQKKVEPKASVRVEILFDAPLNVSGQKNVTTQVVHFSGNQAELDVLPGVETLGERAVAEEGSAPDDLVMEAEGARNLTDNWVAGVSFSADSFSVYGVLITREYYFKTSDGETYQVTVMYDHASAIPEDAMLSVSEIKKDDAEYQEYVEKATEKLGKVAQNVQLARAFDITLKNPATGETYQPSENVQVRLQLLDETLDYENVDVIHFRGEDENQVDLVDSTVQGQSVEFTADGFSVYVVCAYTVDFHWGDYTYSIEGESEISLGMILEKLGVTEIVLSDVTDVSFSNPAYIEIEKVDSNWILKSLAPFDTEEALALTLKNGERVEIRVTDAATLPASGTWDNGSNGSGTWEIDENGVFTISGNGKINDFGGVTSAPWGDYELRKLITKVAIKNGITYLGKNMLTRTRMTSIDASHCSTLVSTGSDLFKQTNLNNTETGAPQNLTSVDFSGCVSFTGFGGNAFQSCSGIIYLDISDTKMSSIDAFNSSKTIIQTLKANNCSKITGSLDLSGYTSLTTLELSGCANLTGVTLPTGIQTLDASGTGLTNLDVTNCTGITSLNVSGCTGLTSLTVPSSVATLDISGCTGLDSLDLSSCTNLTTVKVGDRNDLTDLSWLTLPASVTTLDASGFTSLTSIDIPASVTSLNLSGCTGLTTLDLSDNTSLVDIDLSDNASLTALKLPASVSSLDVNNCPNLVIYFDGTSEEFATLIENLNLPEDMQTITWGDYTYTIQRNSSVSLSDIFTECGITGINNNDVASISVSDTSILSVSGDLMVTSLSAFEEPQTLMIVLNNGITGTIRVVCAPLEESDNLNLFLDADTSYSYEGDTVNHSLSEVAVLNQDDLLHLNLSFSEIPEWQEGERQMTLLGQMKFTLPAGMTVTEFPDTVTLRVQSGGEAYSFSASVAYNEETGVLTVEGDYGDQGSVVSASTMASFTIPVTVKLNEVPGEYPFNNSLKLSVMKPHNAKVSISSEEYDSGSDTIKYIVKVEAESDLDFDGNVYPVEIGDLTTGDSPALQFVSGTYSYTHKDGFDGATESQVNGTQVTSTETDFSGFPLTITHMHEGDTITLTYTAKALKGEYTGSEQAQVQNTVTISNSGNPSNNPEDDTASVTNTVPYVPLTREYVTLDGSWAYWRVTVNPMGYTLDGGRDLTLLDTFHDEVTGDADQSIDYASISVTSAGGVSYDYSGNTGTYVIPDNTAVTISFRTRIAALPGEAKLFRGTALLQDADGNTIATSTAGVTQEAVVIYPSASDVSGSGNYMLKLLAYGEGAMQEGVPGVKFILMDANQRALEYKRGDNAGEPVTFTTGEGGYVNIELNEEPGDVAIEKNTAYYLEMIQTPVEYQKDNTLYNFMITDDSDYNSGGVWTYYNGDTMKVRLYPASAGLKVAIRFSGSYALREDQQNNVIAVLQKWDDDEDGWIEIERHPYMEAQEGSITFDEQLYDAELVIYQNIYRVVEENESPWDLPENINLVTKYYCIVGTGSSDPYLEPQEFSVNNAEESVSVVIDNRYEESQLTIIKMDKSTGEVLPGTIFAAYKIVNGVKSGDAINTYTTDENGELVIRGGEVFESETLYGITETEALDNYLLPQKEEWNYFYFCNDEYLEPRILANLPEGASAVNLTNSGARVTIDNQSKEITIPVMKLWQGNQWPDGAEVLIGLYRSVEGVEGEEKVLYGDGTPRTVTLNSSIPYNNSTFTGLPSRDDQNRNYIYSIKEESINGMTPLQAGYVQEYGVSSSGVYIVRNKPATTLTVSKEWYDFNGDKVNDPEKLNQQSSITFDIYRSSTIFEDSTPVDGITYEDMASFVSSSGVLRVRENVTFGADTDWIISINDLDKQDDLGNPYYYYVLETVPSFANELYEVNEAEGTVTIKNKIAPEIVNLTVTKGVLDGDPREESLDRGFEFTLKLNTGTHPIRSWQVYTDAENQNNNLITDWNGEVKFTLKPTNPDSSFQPTQGASITLNLPAGVTATVTETANPEYRVKTEATATGSTKDDGRTFSYDTNSETPEVRLTYTNTLHVICKVVKTDGTQEQVPFESLKRAQEYLRNNPGSFTSPWTIYLLEDYTIPITDGIEVEEGESLILTTASTTDELFPFKTERTEDTDIAVITRGGTGPSMLTNAGTLTLEKICFDGGSVTATGDGGLVKSTGTLNLHDKTTLRNSVTDGKGGAVYAEGTVNIVDGVTISGNSASSASALYLNGTLTMTGGSIKDNTGASDGAVVVESASDVIELSGNPIIYDNTNEQGKAANLYVGVDSDGIVNVVNPGLSEEARIGISAMEGHMLIGEQFATAEYEQTANLNRFINDVYGYRGKLKNGTSTNIVWNGLTLKIKKEMDPVGANANDRFTITLASPLIAVNTYIIDGTLDYTISTARQNRPGRIILKNVKAEDEITISPVPVGSYTITEADSNYTPTYTLMETGSDETPVAIEDGSFVAENDSTVTVTNTRRLADVKLTKSTDDRLKTADEVQNFNFTIRLTEEDGSAASDFALAEGIFTDANGEVNFTMSPSNNAVDVRTFRSPVGAKMEIIENSDTTYNIMSSAVTMPTEGEPVSITDEDGANANTFAFSVTDDGADVTFANVRNMAEIELRKELINKVSATESFTFTITLTRADGNPAVGYILYRDDDDASQNIITDAEGKAIITFDFERDEATKAIPLTVPEGTKLEVEETVVKKTVNGAEKEIYDTSYSLNGTTTVKSPKLTINAVSESDSSILFTNSRKMQTITVTNKVNGYSGNVVPFTYTATVTDGGEGQDDYDANGFTDGVMTFELATDQSRNLIVPYGATLTVAEGFIVGYGTTVKRGSAAAIESLKDTFVVTVDMLQSSPLLFTNSQLIGLQLVNKTSSKLENVTVTVVKNNIYRVNSDQTGQERISSNRTAILSIEAGETAILEIEHDTSATAEQSYNVKGTTPADGFYYTINNESSFHEFANPAILRIYNVGSFGIEGKLRYSVSDSTITFTEQPLVSFDPTGGIWTTEMEGYKDRNGDRKVYQKAVTNGETVERPTPDPSYPTAEEIAFLGWTTDEEFAKGAHTASEDVSAKLYDFENTHINEPFILYAIWARDPSARTVTVKNGQNSDLTVTVTLANNDPSGANFILYEDENELANIIITDENGEASFNLTASATKNLKVPNGAMLIIQGSYGSAYSTDFVDEGSNAGSFTINPVDKDGTVSFIGGIFKITDAEGNLLYNESGNPAVYTTLASAFAAYVGRLYSDDSHMSEATPAAVKQLVDDYMIQETTPIAFPKATMTLTTAGKDDALFPYVGTRTRGTIYRSEAGKDERCFTLNSGNITLTNIILDGGSEHGVKIKKDKNGGLIYMDKADGVLSVTTGTAMRNCDFADYTDGNNSRGGAICMTNGTLNVDAGLFSNLHAYQGGAICITGGTPNITGTAGSTQFENCYSETQDGGAIYYKANKDLLIDGGENKDNPGIVFTGCEARYSNGTSDCSDGGAIFAQTDYNNAVTVKGCSFIECRARTANSQSTSGYGGGGIAAYKVKELTVSACSFEACDTLCGGGAVATNVKSTTTIENDTVKITNCSFDRCNCKAQGGALAVYQDNNGITTIATRLTIDGTTFNDCSSGTNNSSGGAIQCYLPCMKFVNSAFTDCWAGKEGGAVNNFFGASYTDVWANSSLIVDNCEFLRCRAEDRYDTTALQHYGGGINTKVKTVTVMNSYFEDCVSTLKEGGALHIGGQGNGSKANITGSTFKNCLAKNGGGAMLSSHETLEITNSFFYGCSSSASNGGAVYHYRNSRGDSTQKNTTIKNCTFGTALDDSESEGCSATQNGGAIWTRAESVTIEGCTIDGCIAGGNGGGIYLGKKTSQNATITSATIDENIVGTITNCQATKGSAVYVEDKATFSGNLSISDNIVSDIDDGAIHGGKLYFEGNVKVENNTCSSDPTYKHDVLMERDDVTRIYTTSEGLDKEAHIGVYVPDQYFEKRGVEGKAFGTYGSDNGNAYLDSFFNDRNDELYGYQLSDDNNIYWGIYVCKITDADGNTLTRPNGRDAVYQSISLAFDEFQNVTGGSPVYVKMLVENYFIVQENEISNFPEADITLTTASTSDEKHPYKGTEGTFCTISRDTRYNSTKT